jgi:hypothetical protein
VPPVIVAAEPAAAPAPQPLPPVPPLIQTVTEVAGQALMPDVRGLAAREALRILSGVGLTVRMNGLGVVSSQSPLPGQPIEPGGWGVIQLQRTFSEPRPPGGER